jgi:N-acetylglucosaminyldiphosphoundecaprenol N-acetyl-beta-D-mannosaminyltransferase
MENRANSQEPNIFILLGIPFHNVTMQETLEYVDGMIARRNPAYLATANLDFAAQAGQDVELQRILFEAELVLCDGTPLVWASRWLGAPLRERVAGSDLLPFLFAHAEKMGHRIYFLGSSDEVLETVLEKCAVQYPKLVICGAYSPPYAKLLDLNDAEIAGRVRAVSPDILLVGMGCPKQEKWIYKNYRDLGVPVCIGIGASLDFIAGKFRRAPVWMRVSGLEWIFRLMQEPRRLFSRYLFDLLFFVRTLRNQRRLLRMKGGEGTAAGCAEMSHLENARQYGWSGRIDARAVNEKIARPILPDHDKPNVVLDCSNITFIDSTGLGLFIRSFRQCKAAGGAFVVLNPSQPVEKMLSVMKLDRLIPVARSSEEVSHLLKAFAPGQPGASSYSASSGKLTIPMDGDITAASVGLCESLLVPAWNQNPGAATLQLDLAKVSFIDSSGLGLLVKTFKLVKQRPGAVLEIINVSSNVRNVIKLANLGDMFGLTSGS